MFLWYHFHFFWIIFAACSLRFLENFFKILTTAKIMLIFCGIKWTMCKHWITTHHTFAYFWYSLLLWIAIKSIFLQARIPSLHTIVNGNLIDFCPWLYFSIFAIFFRHFQMTIIMILHVTDAFVLFWMNKNKWYYSGHDHVSMLFLSALQAIFS